MVDRQWKALSLAHRIVTPHPHIASLLRNRIAVRIETIPWVVPAKCETEVKDEGYVYFAGPTAAREGAVAMREAAQRLGLKLSVQGRNLEAPDFWNGCELLDPATHPMSRASAVVCGAVLRNRPSECLKAISMCKKVIATPGCGVKSAICVPFGDADALVEVLTG